MILGFILGGRVMVASLDILDKLREYLRGKLDLQSFRQWMVESHLELQDIKAKHGAVDQDAARLLAELEGRYAELSDELVSEKVWKSRLAALVAPTPKSAESYFLTFFYNVPSEAFQLNSMSVSGAFQDTGNPFNSASNYREPEPAAA
jgi:hypothetical protein